MERHIAEESHDESRDESQEKSLENLRQLLNDTCKL